MKVIPLLQRTLGADWDKLPPVIRQHYQLGDNQQSDITVRGTMEIDYPSFVKPILFVTRLMGALISLKGSEMSVQVKKWTINNSSARPTSVDPLIPFALLNVKGIPGSASSGRMQSARYWFHSGIK